MIAATLFSGIGAPELAMPEWAWRWSAEIEPFAAAVLAARHPQSVNLGDVHAPDFATRAAAVAAPDVLVFGSPCQSFSVAGRRLGLADPRGNLALVALGIVAALGPRWFVFENVPGLLSSDGGRDFGTFLDVVEQCGYACAWAVLDAQYFGVAQRRRRLFVVGHARDWRGPAAVLLEPESLRGHPPTRGQAGEDPAGGLADGFGAHGGELAGAVSSKWAKGTGGPAGDECYNLVVPTLRAGGNETGGHRPPGTDVDTIESLVVTPFADIADPVAANQARTYTREGAHNFRLSNVATAAAGVRRLTPRECERLQGLPDDFTAITYRGKPAADGPRYRAIGNSMAVPVVRWILSRLAAVNA